MDKTEAEPVVTRAAVATLVTAGALLLGYKVDQSVVDALALIVASAAPLVAGVLARRKVTPIGQHRAG